MRSLRPVLLLGAAIAVGALVGLVLLTRGDDTAPPAPDSASIAARASIAPRTHLFGDPLVAELELLFDRRRVEPASVRLDAVFEPYEPLDESRSLERSGDLVRLRYRFSLGCFNPACAPSEARREQGLDRARLSYTLADIDRRVVDPVDWPTFEVASRLGPFDVERARWRADSRRLAAVSYRIRPGVLGAGLIGGALLLVLAAGALGARLLPGREAPVETEAAAGAPPLERAVLLVRRHSLDGSTPEGRRALERLARELVDADRPDLAERARALAWSAQPPPAGAVGALLDDVGAPSR